MMMSELEKEETPWLIPCVESHYLSARWKEKGYTKLLDFGCGLGRHSIFFAQNGFSVSAFDISVDAITHLRNWASNENLKIDMQIANMLSLPYQENAFDCLFAHHVISHTDTAGMLEIMSEIKRVIKPNGELFITLCSKESWLFHDSSYPRIDNNTTIETDDSPQKGVPHYFVNYDEINNMFDDFGFTLHRIRHYDDCYYDGIQRNGYHYFILAKTPQ